MKSTAEAFRFQYEEPAKLDEKDWEILRLLSQNGRMPISSMAKKLGLTRDIVKYRLKRLLTEKVITKFIALTSFPKLGCTIWGYMHIAFKDLTVKRERELIEYVVNDPHVVFTTSTLGSWDFGIEFYAKDLGHFYDLQKAIKEKFADIIKDIDTGSYIAVHKINYVPYKSAILR